MIDIEMLREGEPGWLGEAYGWYAKGHHDPVAFCAAAAEVPIDQRVPTPNEVEYQWWRWVPWGGKGNGYYSVPGEPGTRGCFEVTMVDLETIALRETMAFRESASWWSAASKYVFRGDADASVPT